MAVTILYLMLGNLLLIYRFKTAKAPVQKFHLLLTFLTVFFPPALFSMVFGTMYLFQLDAFFDNDMLFFTSLTGIFVSVSLGYSLIMEDYIQLSIEAQYHQRLAFIGLVDTKLMHDLRSPITYMKHLSQTLSSLLQKQPQDHEKIDSTSNLIHQNADRALSFISSFREQLMQETPHVSKVNIVNLVGEAVSLIRLSTEKEVEINQRIDETLSYYLDRNIFLSMFASLTNGFALWLVNILRNSVDSFSENGRIDITEEVRDGYLRLAITDNGCGIKEEDIERVFDSFYTTKSDSMGLGLFVVKQEVERYGGKVSCESKEGCGTTITIALPLQKEN
ncbi:HAMP domain-containing histidine kinase [bacterium]|nr:HAMP domain-containing histidine kinase [bacterium]